MSSMFKLSKFLQLSKVQYKPDTDHSATLCSNRYYVIVIVRDSFSVSYSNNWIMGSYNFCINLLMRTSEDELISHGVCCCSE